MWVCKGCCEAQNRSIPPDWRKRRQPRLGGWWRRRRCRKGSYNKGKGTRARPGLVRGSWDGLTGLAVGGARLCRAGGGMSGVGGTLQLASK